MIRHNKLILLALAGAILLFTLAAGAGGEPNWNGTFYNYLEENHILAFTFERDGEDESLVGREIVIKTNNGFSRSSVSVNAWIEKGNVAKDNRGYRYTLTDNVLTVKYVDDDEVFGTDFSGTYTRGASIEETFDLADDNEGNGNSGSSEDGEGRGNSIAFAEFYYWDGDANDNSLYFFDDGMVNADTADGQTYKYEYTIKDGIVRIEVDGSEHTLTIIDEYTLETEGGDRYIRLGGADNSRSDIDGNADASAAEKLWSGIFTSGDGTTSLALVNFDGESFQYGFVSSENEDDGAATLTSSESAEADSLTFWFMDNDTLLVSGGVFEGEYKRNPED
jgi:hypothetical protein